MSAVRMCDRCGNIFAEGAEGASVGTMVRNERNPRTGRVEAVSKTMDVGPCCTQDPVASPRLAVSGATFPATLVDDQGETTTAG